MKIGVKEDYNNKVLNAIQELYYIDVEYAYIKGENPTIRHIIQKDKFWTCICGESNNNVNVPICNTCGLMRKLESFPNILNQPNEVDINEIEQLILKRKEECRIFQEKLNDVDKSDKLYAIDLEWFLLWKCFVTNDLTEKYIPNSKKKISHNLNIGVLNPGPISNYSLFDKGVKEFNEKYFRKNLKKNEDYIVINKNLWKFFINNCGGGPEILLDKDEDIYKSTVSLCLNNMPNKKLLNESNIFTRDQINESYVTINIKQHYETRTGDNNNDNKEDLLHQTLINMTNINETHIEEKYSKLGETINEEYENKYNDIDSSLKNKGIIINQKNNPINKQETKKNFKFK